MTSRENQPVTWPDLSPYGIRLLHARLPTGKEMLILRNDPQAVVEPPAKENENLVDRYDRQVAALGFQRHAKGVWHRPQSTQVSTAAFAREFPLSRPYKTTLADVFLDMSKPEPAREEPSAAAVALSKARMVGLNRVGQEVWDGPDGRFVKDPKSGTLTNESEVKPPSPGLFLRAPDGASLAMCADGLIQEVAVRGRIVREDEFLAFCELVHGGGEGRMGRDDARVPAAVAAVEAAASRFLAKRGGSMRDSFNGACRLYESLAFLSTIGRSAPASSVLPPPVAIVMQRVAGNDADLAGRSILVPHAGVGQLLSHLPRGAEVRVSETDAALVPHLDANVQSSALKVSRAGHAVRGLSAKDYKGCDVVLAAYPRRLAEKPIALKDGPSLSRADLGETAAMLEGRGDEGRAVLALQGAASAEEEAELARFQDWIGRRFQIEGVVDVDGTLHAGRADAPPLRLMVVGRRRPEILDQAPESAMTLREVRDFGSLWTWTSEVVSNRLRMEAYFAEGGEGALKDGDPELQTNAFQAPYVSASQIGTPTTMVPRPLEGASREALSKVVRLHGNVDQWVAQQFGYDSAKLGEHFSPEQIDAMALALHAEERGRGFLNADQTGIGKGRFLAAIMRRGVLHKKKVIFFTEKPLNFSDIWRDVAHIGAGDMIQPLIMNADGLIIDERDGKILHRAARKETLNAMLRERAWPKDENAVLMTYSQINKEPAKRAEADAALWKAQSGDKARWLLDVVDRDTVLVLDECHNGASGDSNISETLAQAVRQAGGVVYSSATFAKDAKSMAFYAPLLPDGMAADELAAILAKGGETMQEVVSTMLVQDGVMVRREHDLSNIEFQSVPDSARFDRNRTYMDAFAPVLAEMATVAAEVDRILTRINRQHADRARREGDGDAAAVRERSKSSHLSRTGFGSPLYSLTRLFVASLKIDMAVDRALAALANNEKPIVLVENTIQSFLDELAEREEDLEDASFPEFKGLVHRALTRLTTGTNKIAGQVNRIDLTASDEALQARVARLRGMIDRLPSMPASAIDMVKERINAAGYVCDEITGRALEFTNGRVMRRPSVDKTRIKNAFNAGEIDALVINNAGCTGIDLHAGSRFADKRRRVMIELQELADILRQIQAYGRVNRYDQVVGPRVEAIQSGLPVEIRTHAIRNSKLRRLSANVSSNRDNAALIRDIPDIINAVGDTVCSRYAEARPELMRRLGFEIDRAEKVEEANRSGDSASDSKRSANELLARLIMLPVAMQEQIANELAAEYNATMEELEAKGETPLKTKDMGGVVHVSGTTVFEGAEVENPDSVFQEPLYVTDAAVVRKVDPMRKDAVIDAIQAGLTAASAARGEAIADHLIENRESILETYLPDGVASVRDGLATGHRALVQQNARLEKLAAALREIRPGCEIAFSSIDDDKPSLAVVTAVRHAPVGFEHVASLHAVEFVRPGDVQPHAMKLKTLMEDEHFKVSPGLEGNDYDAIMRRFDDATVSKVHSARILTGNIFRGMRLAVEHRLGTLVTFERNDGTKHRGILVAKRFRNMDVLPVELDGPEMATDAFRKEHAELRSSVELGKNGVSLTRLKSGGVQLEIPPAQSRRYGHLHAHEEIQELLRRSSTKDGMAKILLTEDEIARKLRMLFDLGVRLWCSGKHRKWATEYHNKAAAPERQTTKERAA